MQESIREQLDRFFKTQEQEDKDVLNQIILYIYYLNSKSSNSDLFILAKLLPQEHLYKIISYYDGDILKMPSKEEFKISYIISVCFYLKEIKNWSWTQIKGFFPSNDEYDELLSTISLGKKINKIKENLSQDLFNLLKNLELEQIEAQCKEIFKDE